MGRISLDERVSNGRLAQIGRQFKGDKNGHWFAVFKCECGASKVIAVCNVKKSRTVSCGCLRSEKSADRKRKHGHASRSFPNGQTRAYSTWQAMRSRCKNKKHNRYHIYGGRGISVCSRWDSSFEEFLKDMGDPPEGMSIERIDVDADYCPENCIWATQGQQAVNRRTTRLIEYEGKTMCLSEWSIYLGIPYMTLRARLLVSEWSVARSFTEPVRKTRDNHAKT